MIVAFGVTIIAYSIMVYTFGLTSTEKESIRIILDSLKNRR
jgi:hypothetical protein